MFLRNHAHQVHKCNFRPTLTRTFTDDPKDTKFRFRIWHDVFEWYKMVHLRTKIVVTVGSIFAGAAFYYYHKDKLVMSTTDAIVSAFEQGRGYNHNLEADNEATIDREELYSKIHDIFTPKKIKHYAVVVGERGCGKSTAVRKVIASLPEPRGIIYFDAPVSPKQFSVELASSIGVKDEIDMVGGVHRYLSGLLKEEKKAGNERRAFGNIR